MYQGQELRLPEVNVPVEARVDPMWARGDVCRDGARVPLPWTEDTANLFFQLVSSRYEHASLILPSILRFARWGDVFGDQVVASARKMAHFSTIADTSVRQK